MVLNTLKSTFNLFKTKNESPCPSLQICMLHCYIARLLQTQTRKLKSAGWNNISFLFLLSLLSYKLIPDNISTLPRYWQNEDKSMLVLIEPLGVIDFLESLSMDRFTASGISKKNKGVREEKLRRRWGLMRNKIPEL